VRRNLAIAISVAIIAIALAAVYAIYQGAPVYQPYSPPQAQRSPTTQPMKTIEVELDDYYFKPSSITIIVGEPVRLVLNNEGRSAHTFTVDELGINVRLAPGETRTIDITPTKAGSYLLYCIPHRALGMVGNITITSAPKYS